MTDTFKIGDVVFAKKRIDFSDNTYHLPKREIVIDETDLAYFNVNSENYEKTTLDLKNCLILAINDYKDSGRYSGTMENVIEDFVKFFPEDIKYLDV